MTALWRWLASFRRRILFRTVFLLLALATVGLAVAVLQQEKQLSVQNYREGLRKTEAQLLARLRHPSGQLALMNPQAYGDRVTPLRPLVLPYSAIDFDDPYKAQQAVELSGCQVRYPPHGAVCVAIAHTAWAGGYLYVAGSFASGPLVPRERGVRDVTLAHRVRVTLAMRGQTEAWIAPFELTPGSPAGATRGRLTGFPDTGPILEAVRPDRDFRGWLWQDRDCVDTATVGSPQAASTSPCLKRSFFSIRLPVDAFREALFDTAHRVVWPPRDLDRIVVHVQVLAPGDGRPLLDSDDPSATPPFSLPELRTLLLPGEALRVVRDDGPGAGDAPVLALTGSQATPTARPWLARLVQRLPAEGQDGPITLHDTIATPLGSYQLELTGAVRSVDTALAAVAERLAWFVGAMLTAIVLAWLIIEWGLIRRISVLTRRARAVSRDVQGAHGLAELEVADLRGNDELGILAGALADLLQRVKEDMRRERLRAEQEKDLWHAVGHEIMSPLQSLLALHGRPGDPSARYIERMQQAVRVLYGHASPSEAFEATTLQVQPLDLHEFLRHVASNALCVGVDRVELQAAPGLGEVMVRADEYPLEDVVTHVLRNADRYRVAGTPITIRLDVAGAAAEVRIHNQGPNIAPQMLETIFEYGVSDPQAAAGADGGRRGQGLFVAKTYLAKMGGTIHAENTADGVTFVLTLQRG
jgi:signal transduction histidine kinase